MVSLLRCFDASPDGNMWPRQDYDE
jgi:hypothetical protein